MEGKKKPKESIRRLPSRHLVMAATAAALIMSFLFLFTSPASGQSVEIEALDIVDSTVRFNTSYFPGGYVYNLSEMIGYVNISMCNVSTIDLVLEESENFIITRNPDGTITIIPHDPDWTMPTTETLDVSATCLPNQGIVMVNESVFGNADIILISDSSGSMKKALNDSESQGNMYWKSCDFTQPIPLDARRFVLSACLDIELINTVMSYEGNRLWPLFINNWAIQNGTEYRLEVDPTDAVSIVDYVDEYIQEQGKGRTCLACAINAGYNILQRESSANRSKVIVLMTDGVPTHCPNDGCNGILPTPWSDTDLVCLGFCDETGQSDCPGDGCNDDACLLGEQSTIYSAERATNDLDVIFYTIGFGEVESCTRSITLMNYLAELNGGEYHRSSDPNELKAIYDHIARTILNLTGEVVVTNLTINISDAAKLTIIYEKTTSCGNGLLEVGEQCDDGNLISYDGCSEMCMLEAPELVLGDSYISFDYSYYPGGYDYSLTDMISKAAWFPWPLEDVVFSFSEPVNFTITVQPGTTGNLTIVPLLPKGWYAPTNSTILVSARFTEDGITFYEAEAYLTIRYTGEGMPEGWITCLPEAPRYLLHDGQWTNIQFSEVFEFSGDPGVVTSVWESGDTSSLIFQPIPSAFPQSMNVMPDGLSEVRIFYLSLQTSYMFTSEACPVYVFSLGSNCEKQECSGCSDYECLAENDCLDKRIIVLNPYTPVRPFSLIPPGAPGDYSVLSFRPVPESPFIILPSAADGSKFQLFNVSGPGVENGLQSAAILRVEFEDYPGEARVCPELFRLNYNLGMEITDPETDLLMAGSRAVIGYYDFNGQFVSENPYLFTAKVWQRRGK